ILAVADDRVAISQKIFQTAVAHKLGICPRSLGIQVLVIVVIPVNIFERIERTRRQIFFPIDGAQQMIDFRRKVEANSGDGLRWGGPQVSAEMPPDGERLKRPIVLRGPARQSIESAADDLSPTSGADDAAVGARTRQLKRFRSMRRHVD